MNGGAKQEANSIVSLAIFDFYYDSQYCSIEREDIQTVISNVTDNPTHQYQQSGCLVPALK